jgi:hypothetical protein
VGVRVLAIAVTVAAVAFFGTFRVVGHRMPWDPKPPTYIPVPNYVAG